MSISAMGDIRKEGESVAWETIAQIYRAQGIPHGTTYWDIDTDTTELNDDFTKYITIQFNGQTLYVTKSAVYDFESYGGAIILVVKDTTNSGYIRERLIHSQSSYNYTTLLTPNYTENGLKVYIKSLSPEHLPNVQIPVTSNVGGTPMTSNISIFSDRITRVYTYQDYMALMELPKITSNGGGATHIAKVTGQLKDLSSNLSDILMVSGGGGGGLLVGDTDYSGKEAGGISGSGDNSADQSTGNAFGQGESGTNVSGGGSGLYGGYKGTSAKSGGAGSGYIGNSLVSNKKMVGYNVPTSSAEGTKTESVNEVSASAVSGKPKSGNGFARIKFLREVGHVLFKDIVKTTDKDHEKHTSYDGSNPGVPVNNLSSYFETDYILSSRQSNANYLASFNGNEGSGSNKSSSTSCIIYYPIPKTFIKNVKYKYKFASGSSSQYAYVNVGLGYVENGQMKYADNEIVKSNTNYQTDWKEVSFTINTPKLFDYLVMWVCDYTWMFKDIEFNYE